MEALLTLMLLGGFVGSLAFIFLLGRRLARPMEFACPGVLSNPIPFRRRSFLFSTAERSLYKVLRTLLPDHMIFVKVRLADLMAGKRSDPSFWEYFSPINRKQVDFVVCDPTLAPVLAIEMEHSHPLGRRHTDDALTNSVLASVSVPMVRVPERRSYVDNELSHLLAPYLRVPAPII